MARTVTISTHGTIIADNISPGTHSYTYIGTQGLHSVEIGTMAGTDSVDNAYSMIELNEVQTPVMIGCGQGTPYGYVTASSEYETC